ncbi:MAG TPA: TonB-dependent receptor [Chitinophagaceae bacterium]|nr:TonB-dependent receptor [Chitinophagaceae bacterium]
MKKLLLATGILLFTAQLHAQFPAGGAAGKGQQQAMNIGHVYGKVMDSLDKPIAEASVVLLQNKYDSATKKRKDILLKAMNTTALGEFSFEDLPLFGTLKLKIVAVGYKPYNAPVAFQINMGGQKPGAATAPANSSNPMAAVTTFANMVDKDLGNIKLVEDVNQLKAVTVTASAPGLRLDIDKKVFNVDKNIVSSGGTAVDVMRNVPSVQVDIDGNVKLRNASPQIYIDGRPTTLTLDQIPADAIESVEVITNPSAKYDASGGNAGILNIVLKKNKKTGYNGNLMAGVDSKGGFNGGGNFNVRQGKINFTAATMVNAMHNKATGTTDRYTYGSNPTHVYQTNSDKTTGAFIFGRLGLDYYVTNRTTLSLAGIKVHGEFKPNSTITTDSLNSAGDMFKYSDRITSGTRTFNATGLQFGMVHNFPKAGEQWTADGNYFSGKNNSNSMYTTNNYLGDKTFIGQSLQQQISTGGNDFFTIQSDYVNPLTKKTKLEAGVRAQIRKTTNNNDIFVGSTAGNLTKIPQLTNNYKNTDQVYAAYTTITSSIKDFGYQLGLRAESSKYDGELTNTGQKFSNSYPISLFPSVFLSQKLKNNQELQANYSRRVNRPNFFQLIPYTDFSDSLNITIGNPNLKPEFTNSFEMSYSKTFKGGNNLLFSIYYKHSTDLITRYTDSETIASKTLLVNRYINAESSYSYGAELTSINKVKNWWEITTNINIYNGKINTSNVPNATPQDAILSWFGKLNNNFKLPKNFTIQLSGNYQSKTNLPVSQGQGMMGPPGMQAQSSSQGYIKPFWSVDLAVRKAFLKNQAAAVSVSISDIFRTRANEQVSTNPGIFYQDYYRLNNPQLVRINFTYRFGKMDVSLFKRQNTKSTGSQDAMQMGGQ